MSESNWHSVTVTLPLPSADQATLIKSVIQVDKPLRPTEVIRTLTVHDASLVIEFKAVTVRQARVALDHCLSDVQLVVQTMRRFAPERQVDGGEEAESLEVGLMGSWSAA